MACGGGGNGSPGVGNTKFSVENTSGYDIARVSFLSAEDVQIFSQKFECSANSRCNFYATLNESGTVLFYDSRDTIIGAYVLTSVPGSFQAVRTSRTMLGLYVFGELMRKYAFDPSLLYVKLDHLFTNYNSPDGTPDKYQELGMYYRYKMIGQSLSTDEFYAALYDHLAAGDILPSGLYAANDRSWIQRFLAYWQKNTFINTAYASEGETCPAGFTLDLADNAISFIPIMGLSDLFGQITAIGREACDGKTATLSDISTKLDEIEAMLKKQDIKLDAIIKLIGNENVRTAVNNINTDNSTVKSYADAYQALVTSNGYQTLSAYFADNGGVKHTYKSSYPNNVQLLINSRSMDDVVLKSIAIGGSDYKSLFGEGIRAMCNNVASGTDVIKARIGCNVLIARYKAIVAYSNGNMITILKDVTDALDAYNQKEADFIHEVTLAKRSWAEYFRTEIQAPLQRNLSSLNSGLGPTQDGYFVASQGLPSQLLSNLKNIGCETSGEAAVIGWVENGSESYVTTRCKNGNNFYKSKYYYVDQGVDVINMLGVVVPRRSGNAAESTGLRDNIALYVSNIDMAVSTQELSDIVTNDRGNSVFRDLGSYNGGYKNYAVSYQDLSNAYHPQRVYFRYAPNYWGSDPEVYAWAVNFYQSNSYEANRRMAASMQCLTTKGCSASGGALSFDGGPQRVWYGNVLEEGKTVVFNQLAYSINGTVLSPSQ